MGPLGWQETLFIFLLALLIFGPKKLPELGRNIGKAITEFRRASSELKATFDREMRSLEQENQALQEVTRSYDYDYSSYDYNYDSSYYDSGSDSSSYDSTSASYDSTDYGAGASTKTDARKAPEATSAGMSTDSVSASQGAVNKPGASAGETAELAAAPEPAAPETQASDAAAVRPAGDPPAIAT